MEPQISPPLQLSGNHTPRAEFSAKVKTRQHSNALHFRERLLAGGRMHCRCMRVSRALHRPQLHHLGPWRLASAWYRRLRQLDRLVLGRQPGRGRARHVPPLRVAVVQRLRAAALPDKFGSPASYGATRFGSVLFQGHRARAPSRLVGRRHCAWPHHPLRRVAKALRALLQYVWQHAVASCTCCECLFLYCCVRPSHTLLHHLACTQ